MSKQMKAADIIRETVAHFKTNPRGVFNTETGTQCRYNWEDGSHCAVGRCLDKKYQDMGKDMPANDQSVDGLLDELRVSSIDVILQEKYRGQSQDFWEELHDFHDICENWYSTHDGKKVRNRLTSFGEDQFYILMNRHQKQEEK